MNSIRSKIFSGLILLTMITVLVGGWAIYNFINLSTTLNGILIENYGSVAAAGQMQGALERQDSAQLLLLFGNDQEAKMIFTVNEREFFRWLTRAEENITIEAEEPIIGSIREKYSQYLQTFFFMSSLPRDDGNKELGDYYYSQSFPLFQELQDETRRLLDVNQEVMISENEKAKRVTQNAIASTGFLSIGAIVLGFFLNSTLVRMILQPVVQLTENVRLVRDGRLNEIEEIRAEDEVGELTREFGRMTAQLKEYEQKNTKRLIAEQKKTEAIVRSITDAIIVTNAECKIVLVNEQAEDIFEISEEEVVDRHFLEVIHDEHIFKTIKKVLLTGKPVRNIGAANLIRLKVHHEIHYYQMEVTPVIGPEGQTLGTVTLLPDITHFKTVDQLKSDFVNTVSHEFRSPLATIQMGVELLQENYLPSFSDEGKEMLAAMSEDALRLNYLVNDLLDLSKMEEGRIELHIREISIDELVIASLNLAQAQAEEKQITLTKDIPIEPFLIEVDKDKIVTVVTNLIGNAIRYTKNGGEIKVTAKKQGLDFIVAVSDNGIGIPKEYLDSIFNKFVQIQGSACTPGSAGLGLSIAQEIIQAHQGRIWAESEEGKGATFTFMLPQKAASAEEPH